MPNLAQAAPHNAEICTIAAGSYLPTWPSTYL